MLEGDIDEGISFFFSKKGERMNAVKQNRLGAMARFSLFSTSYSPLFLIMIIRQVSQHRGYLSWGGFDQESFQLLMKYFGLSIMLGIVITLGFAGIYVFVSRIGNSARINGVKVQLKGVKNRNSESISYIGTYIIPFLFQDYSSLVDLVSVIILLTVIYFIYINSSLLLINPALNLRYSLYDVEFTDDIGATDVTVKTGMVISRLKFLEDGEHVLFKNIGHKLYFAVPVEGV